MGAFDSYNNPQTQRTGNDAIYGQGTDGTISTASLSLTADGYYDNLTVQASGVVYLNGFRLFVKNTLTLENGAQIIASDASNQPAGGTTGGVTNNSAVVYALGGAGGGGTANAAPTWVLNDILETVNCRVSDNGSLSVLFGGGAGGQGSAGSNTPA